MADCENWFDGLKVSVMLVAKIGEKIKETLMYLLKEPSGRFSWLSLSPLFFKNRIKQIVTFWLMFS